MTEQTVTVRVYSKDLFKVAKFMEQKGIKTTADGFRVVVEYCNAQGVFK